MQHLLRLRRSIHSAAAFAAGRALSTAAPPSRPRWAMIFHAEAARSSPAALRASFQLAEPPRASNLHVPAHLLDLRPLTDPRSQMRLLGGCVRGASVDGLLLLDFSDGLATGPVVGVHPDGLARQFTGFDKRFDVTRFVCNPITGQLFRMPDIDGTKDTSWCQFTGILTQSDRPDGPPDRYAVAWLSVNDRDDNRRIAMRRFLSQRGEWDKPVGLPSPLPLARRMDVTHEVVAFAGRLWWVDVSWGAVSVDPFSDRPELQFVELPRGSVTEPVEEGIRKLGRFRRVGVSEGRLRYAEVSQKQPFVLSSFALDDNGSSWTLEHRVALSRLGLDGCHTDPEEDDTPRIGVIDPLNASTMYLTIGDSCVSVDMERGEVLGRSQIGCSTGPFSPFSGFLTPCVLPPWLGEFHIPSAGTLSSTKANIRSKTMADTLVRVDRDMKS